MAAGTRNRILAGLPAPERDRILAASTPVTLEFKMKLSDEGSPVSDVYFLEAGVSSMVNTMADGSVVEVATVGHEGMVGLPAFFDTDRMPGEEFIQIPGHGWRLSRDRFREFLHEGQLSSRVSRYAQAVLVMISQGSACNRIHTLEQRCARWLLMTHDRVETDEFPLTHEFLAQMLGVRRAGVSEAASALQDAGLITYTRGSITVVNRKGLQNAACECYSIVTAELDRLLGL